MAIYIILAVQSTKIALVPNDPINLTDINIHYHLPQVIIINKTVRSFEVLSAETNCICPSHFNSLDLPYTMNKLIWEIKIMVFLKKLK